MKLVYTQVGRVKESSVKFANEHILRRILKNIGEAKSVEKDTNVK
jgi:hypothetical protein